MGVRGVDEGDEVLHTGGDEFTRQIQLDARPLGCGAHLPDLRASLDELP